MDSSWFKSFLSPISTTAKSMLMAQLRATKGCSMTHFYRKVRSPRSVYDLIKDLNDNHLVWMDDERFISLPKGLRKSVPYFAKFRKATSSIDFSRKTQIYGTSNEIVARVTAQFLCLKSGIAEAVRVGNQYSRALIL